MLGVEDAEKGTQTYAHGDCNLELKRYPNAIGRKYTQTRAHGSKEPHKAQDA